MGGVAGCTVSGCMVTGVGGVTDVGWAEGLAGIAVCVSGTAVCVSGVRVAVSGATVRSIMSAG